MKKENGMEQRINLNKYKTDVEIVPGAKEKKKEKERKKRKRGRKKAAHDVILNEQALQVARRG